MQLVNPVLVPERKLSDGMVIPGIGMGTFGNDRYSSGEVSDAVYGAIKAGYRLFDCAAAYGNEKEIGQVFQKAFADGIVQREDLTIMTKVWNDRHGEGDVLVACAQSLRDLKLSYLDIYMVHWPFPNYHAPGAHLEGRNPDAVPFSLEEYLTTWRQMERLVDLGLVKSIGMSNMTITKLEQGIQLIAFSPMGSPCRPARDTEEGDVVTFELPALKEIAAAHHCHPATICVKWAVQRGQIPIPFSIYEKEYVENLKCVTEDFLTDEEMERLRKADQNARLIKGKVFLWEEAEDWRDIWDGEDAWNIL